MDFADVYTRNTFEEKKYRKPLETHRDRPKITIDGLMFFLSKTLALIKPDAYPHIGKIIAMIQKEPDMNITNCQMIHMSRVA